MSQLPMTDVLSKQPVSPPRISITLLGSLLCLLYLQPSHLLRPRKDPDLETMRYYGSVSQSALANYPFCSFPGRLKVISRSLRHTSRSIGEIMWNQSQCISECHLLEELADTCGCRSTLVLCQELCVLLRPKRMCHAILNGVDVRVEKGR